MRRSIGKWFLSILLWVWTGTLYFFIEVMWKSAHGKPESISWTMLLLAMILAIPLERFGAELPWEMPLSLQAVICGTAITVTEFLAGLVLNVWLKMGVWDYSQMKYNILGQVCPQFLLIWVVLAAVGIVMLDWMRYAIEGGKRPHYSLF